MDDLVDSAAPAQAAREQIVAGQRDEQAKSGDFGELADRCWNDEVVRPGYAADGFVGVGVNVLQSARTLLPQARYRLIQFTKGRERFVLRLTIGGQHLACNLRL